MTTEIAPALTPAEWADPWWLLDDADALAEGQLWWSDGRFSVGYDSGYVAQDIDATPVQIMAVANSVLPPDSLYKITELDVEFLRLVACTTPYSGSNGDSVWFGRLAAKLAAKLAALLPPE